MRIKSKQFDFILQPCIIIIAILFFATSQKTVAQKAPIGFTEDFSSSQLQEWQIFTGSGEFDTDDVEWHIVSYTDTEFGAKPTDRVFVQLAVMDAGREVITVELKYVKVTIVDVAAAPPDFGNPMPYRPLLKKPEDFTHSLTVKEDAIIDIAYPWVNFSKWRDATDDSEPLLSISGTQTSVLRWDFSGYACKKPKGWGLLVLTTHNVQYAPSDLEEFGYLLLVEIKAGNPQDRPALYFDIE